MQKHAIDFKKKNTLANGKGLRLKKGENYDINLEYLTEDDIIYIKRQMLNCICDELNPESDQNATFVAR